MISTRAKSVINIFVLRLCMREVKEEMSVINIYALSLLRNQPEDMHLDDEEYEYPRQERNQFLCAESLAESAGGCASGRRGV